MQNKHVTKEQETKAVATVKLVLQVKEIIEPVKIIQPINPPTN